MQFIKLDTILLFILIIPFVMGHRISPFETQYWFFGIIFFGCFVNVYLDLNVRMKKKHETSKNIVLWLLVVMVIGSSFYAAINKRHKTHPIYQVHDIILQQEVALRYLLDGKNPYYEKYFGTFMEQWPYHDKDTNPALYHFVMQPFYLLFTLPFYYISNHTIGYFDGRIPLVLLFFVLLIGAYAIVREPEKKRLFVILIAFNPAILPYTLEGRSDVFMYTFLFMGFYLVQNEKYLLSGIPIALAFATKQSSWPFLPFYVLYLLWTLKNVKKTIITLIPFCIIFLSIVLPFYLWDSRAFIDSTIGFINGTVKHSYPISGYGLGAVLLEFNIIKDKTAFYPFHFWQLFIGIPVFLVLVKYLKKNMHVNVLILVYGIFLFVYWYFSRYFNNSHLAYISMVLTTSYFWPKDIKS